MLVTLRPVRKGQILWNTAGLMLSYLVFKKCASLIVENSELLLKRSSSLVEICTIDYYFQSSITVPERTTTRVFQLLLFFSWDLPYAAELKEKKKIR